MKSAGDWIQGVLGAGAGSTPLPGTGTSVGDALTGGGKQAELDRGPDQEEAQAAVVNASSGGGEAEEEESDSLDEGTVTLRSALVDQIVSRVRDYLALTSNATAAGLAKSGEAQVRSKGDISLALSGAGEGINLGVEIGQFKIEPAR